MALTAEQKVARDTQRINRLREELRSLKRRKSSSERAARNHRLIEAAAVIEAEAKRYGIADFEIDSNKASEIAQFWFHEHENLSRDI